MERISISIAEIAVGKNSTILETQSLGSCVGVALYDPLTKIGALAHIMLPDSKKTTTHNKSGKYADTAIKEMYDRMIALGAEKRNITAKIAGGACMFSGVGITEFMNIGLRNITAVKNVLKELDIYLSAEDCGGNRGRTIEFSTETGFLTIKSAMHEVKVI